MGQQTSQQPRREDGAALRVRILGPVQFEGDGPRARLAPKQRAVLALLAARAGAVVPTPTLIRALWDDIPPASASGSLQAHISRLRRTTGDLIVAEPGGYRLAVAPDAVDALRFERLVDDARAARVEGDHERTAELLDAALALWRGDPLADAPPTEELSAIAVALGRLKADAYETRMDVGLDLGQHDALLPELERAVRTRPEREHLWAGLMLALYRSGRQADALRTYQRARAYLVDEIGVEPGLELRGIERAILDQDPALDLAPPSVRRVRVPTAGRLDGFPAMRVAAFIGRDDERLQLSDAWRAATEGTAQLAWVTGEPGIGKTTLLTEFAARAVAEGAHAVYGASAESPVGSYQPFLEAMPFCVPDDLDQLPPRLWPLAHLLPGLADLAPAGATTDPREPGVAQFMVFEAVADLRAAAADTAPLLLVLDDLHWADGPTLDLLRHVLRRLSHSRLLIAAAARDTEEGSNAPTRAVTDLGRHTPVHRIQLSPFSESEVRELLTGALGAPERGQVSPAGAVAHAPGGNPLLVRELARNLAGAIGAGGDIAVPDSVADLVLDRVHRLGEAVTDVLRVAALTGPTFEAQLVIDASSMSADAVLNAAEAARDAGILQELGDDRWMFVHDLVRQAIVRTISESRATRLHGRVADAIGARHAGERAWAIALAQHCAAAGAHVPRDVARRAYQRAADHALADCAWEDAHRWSGLALALGDTDQGPAERCDALLVAGRAAYALGRRDEYRDMFRAAASEARRAGLPAQLALAALGFTAWNISIDQAPEEELELLHAALELLPDDDDRLRARLLGALFSLLSVRATRAELGELLDEALRRARRSGDPLVLSLVLADADNALGSVDDAEARFAVAEELEPLARSLEDRELLAYALLARQNAQYELGQADEAEWVRDELEELFASLGHAKTNALLALGRLTRPLLEGRFAEFLELWDPAFELAAVSPLSGDHLAEAAAHLYLYWWFRDELRDHVGDLEELVADAPALRGFVAGLALAKAEAGDVDGACRAIEQTLGEAGFPENLERSATLFVVSAALRRLGAAAPPIDMIPLLTPYAGKVCMLNGRLFIGAYDLQLGWALMRAGRAAEAVEALERAVALHERFGADPWTAVSQEALAEARSASSGQA